MPRPKAKAPARRYHISGQSVVTIAGRDIYLGKHDSPEAIARYAVLMGIYQRNGLSIPEDFDPSSLDQLAAVLLGSAPNIVATDQSKEPLLVRHVTALYREHVKEKYPSKEQERHRYERLCNQLDDHHGDVTVDQFGPVRLKAFSSWNLCHLCGKARRLPRRPNR